MFDPQRNTAPFQTLGVFQFEAGKRLARMILNLTFLPLVESGIYRMKVYLRPQGEEQWNEMGDCPISISNTRVGVARPVGDTA